MLMIVTRSFSADMEFVGAHHLCVGEEENEELVDDGLSVNVPQEAYLGSVIRSA